MIDIINELNATVAALSVFVATVTPLAIKFWGAISGTRSDIKALLDAQSKMNEGQQAMLEGQQNMITAQQSMLETQQAEIERLSAALNIVTKFVENRNEDEHLRTKILNIGDSVLKANPNLHPDFVALIMEGTKAASIFFVDLSKKLNRSPALIEAEAMQILKSLRANTVGSEYLTKDARDKIRDKVGRPMVKGLITKLELLQQGNYNGKTRQKYEGIVLSWVLEFLESAVKA